MKTFIFIYLIGAFVIFLIAYYFRYKDICKINRKRKSFLKVKISDLIWKSLIFPVSVIMFFILSIIEVTAEINSRKEDD